MKLLLFIEDNLIEKHSFYHRESLRNSHCKGECLEIDILVTHINTYIH